MGTAVNDVIFYDKSVDNGIAVVDKGASQAPATVFGDELARQAANGGVVKAASQQTNGDSGQISSPISNPPATQPVASKVSAQLTDLAQKVDGAVSQAETAQSTLENLETAAAAGDSDAQAELNLGSAQREVTRATANLRQAINNEIAGMAGPNPDAAAVINAGENIAARYASDPAASTLVTDTVLQVLTTRLVTIVGKAATGLDKTVAEAALDQMVSEFEKFSKSNQNHVELQRAASRALARKSSDREPWLARAARLVRSWRAFPLKTDAKRRE